MWKSQKLCPYKTNKEKNMNREANIEQFEELMSAIERPGIDKLMDYIRKSDFYTAPASTKFHLSCKGGLDRKSVV